MCLQRCSSLCWKSWFWLSTFLEKSFGCGISKYLLSKNESNKALIASYGTQPIHNSHKSFGSTYITTFDIWLNSFTKPSTFSTLLSHPFFGLRTTILCLSSWPKSKWCSLLPHFPLFKCLHLKFHLASGHRGNTPVVVWW